MKRTYRPKVGAGESLVVTVALPVVQVGTDGEGVPVYDREPGEAFEAGGDERPWPYTTDNEAEIRFLDDHPMVTDRPLPKKPETNSEEGNE